MTRDDAKKWLKSNRSAAYKDHMEAFWAGYFDGDMAFEEMEPYDPNVDSPGEYWGIDSEAWLDGYDCGHTESPYHDTHKKKD